MNQTPRLLLVDAAPDRAQRLADALSERGLTPLCNPLTDAPLEVRPRAFDAAILVSDPGDAEALAERIEARLAELTEAGVAAMVWGLPTPPALQNGREVEWLPPDASLAEVVGCLTAVRHYGPLVSRLDSELANLQRLGKQLSRYFEEIDREMCLAGRLQRDFLPECLPDLGQVSFARVYRPATWVSGDLYDVFSVDRRNVGVLIADAMGHGMAAALMTMFIRQAFYADQLRGDTNEMLPPAEVLAQLDHCLQRQELPDSMFVTGIYGIIDTHTGVLRVARGGHPPAIRISPAGMLSEIDCEGGLLGLRGVDPDFREGQVTLTPGEKVIFYTDGVEELFVQSHANDSEGPEFTPLLHGWAQLSSEQLVQAIEHYLDCQEGSLNPADDVTIVVLEMST